ncbi:Transposon TX1 uncharacterized protein [Grifola frondosa]|uniref:Transposon TX1 uncharacterized protein n=1 Tax=Grifola frondosa TaxID=5627 RepID=A0A1C7M7S3_GRIFR|nr:Transposon TX1 uncharacterized protein [Grifola frondosa]
MAGLARDYHEKLQEDGVNPNQGDQTEATVDVLGHVTTRLSSSSSEHLGQKLSALDVLGALERSTNGMATGLNGLPYEFWKAINARCIVDVKQKKPAFDVIKMLTLVYNDIEQYGVLAGSDFAVGWICPLYKKKDREDIANYRPITLLNTDYKIFTKALAMKLAETVPAIIHENQAGFVPGRSIFDQVKLSKLMIDYAEATEENGVIVALDQEKAYDKIGHDYLWKTLGAFGLPAAFITMVKHLYDTAESVVIINGEMSLPFRMTRGVRQGDPMSCLLFDLAIEPLACMLRHSVIRGFHIPGVAE